MKKTETTFVLIALTFGILSTLDIIKHTDKSYFVTPFLISIVLLAIYYLRRNKNSIYTIFFGLSLLIEFGALLKLLHLQFAGLVISIGLISSTCLYLLFVIRPIKQKEQRDLNFYLITGISVLSISQWIQIIMDPSDIKNSMIMNIMILMLIGLLNVFSKPKNKRNQYEFDILTYNFVVLFTGTLDYFN